MWCPRAYVGLLLVAVAPASSDGDGDTPMKGINLTILSFNARNYNDGEEWFAVRRFMLRDEILRSRADVVTVQEMRNASGRGDMHADLFGLIGGTYPHGWWHPAMTYPYDANNNQSLGYGYGETVVEGQSYFSKTALVQPSPDYHALATGANDLNDRIAARLLVRPASLWTGADAGRVIDAGQVDATVYPGCYVAIFATHLSTNAQDQLANANELLLWIASFAAANGVDNGVSRGIIGDLNAYHETDMATGANNSLLDRFEHAGSDPYQAIGPQDMCTYHCDPPYSPGHRDRFLVSAGNGTDTQHSDCHPVGNHSISDHLGLLCTFAVATPQVGERCFGQPSGVDTPAPQTVGPTQGGGGSSSVGGSNAVGDARTGSTVPWAVGVTVFFVIAMAVVISVKLKKFGTGRGGNGSRKAGGGGRRRKKPQQYKVFGKVPCGTEPLVQQGIEARRSTHLSPQLESDAYAGDLASRGQGTRESDL